MCSKREIVSWGEHLLSNAGQVAQQTPGLGQPWRPSSTRDSSFGRTASSSPPLLISTVCVSSFTHKGDKAPCSGHKIEHEIESLFGKKPVILSGSPGSFFTWGVPFRITMHLSWFLLEYEKDQVDLVFFLGPFCTDLFFSY